jgi:hypothetical protein
MEKVMDHQIKERNRGALDRMRAIAARLSEEDLLRPIDPPWTAAALFAHVAFWDRFTHARWLHAREPGGGLPDSIDDAAMELVNQAALPEWAVIPPRTAVAECLAAAQAIDDFIDSLEPDAVAQVLLAGRERLVDRSIHRGEHVDTIEGAFPDH